MYKSRCKTCKKVPCFAVTEYFGGYINHWWNGDCLSIESDNTYVPSDNLEYLEWCYDKKVKEKA